MQYCVDHPEEVRKLAKVKAQVSEVKGVMMENIEKVLVRGEKIELLVDETETLRSHAQDFRQQGTQVRRKMWLQNMKIKLIVLGIIIALILIIISSVCHGIKCKHAQRIEKCPLLYCFQPKKKETGVVYWFSNVLWPCHCVQMFYYILAECCMLIGSVG